MKRAPKPPGAPLPPGVLRRKELRRQRRGERLRQLWRILVFSGLSAGLGYLLLRQGWTLREPAQVEVLGSAVVSRDQAINAAGLRFPQPLMGLQPRQVASDLMGALPVEQVKVSRLMLPPRLRVELKDREAVARAERRTDRGPEVGFVDGLGNWISIRQHQGVRSKGDLSLLVVGWNARHRAVLAQVLKQRQLLGPGLREIRFEPDGSLWLVTTQLGRVRLGPPDARLNRRLEVAAHLGRTLPARIKGSPPQLIDLSDPEQPELSLTGKDVAPAAAPGATAGPTTPPAGAQ
ncbi:cell division protein FtsQ/DivIB [Synechococcus sp. CCY 9618]|uniref:cell division protein FtsQ/DivIB n=1 Tax=Synechococcus sp. CCY 9618 TaxID=2815602 RepID=UPI00352ED7AF